MSLHYLRRSVVRRLLSLAVFPLLTTVGLPSLSTASDSSEYVRHLTLAAQVYDANLSRIDTWQGSVKINDEHLTTGKNPRTQASTVAFVLDRKNDRLRWEHHKDALTERLADGSLKQLPDRSASGDSTGLIRDGTYTSSRIRSIKEGRVQRQATIHPDDDVRFTITTDAFDPMFFFGFQGTVTSAALGHYSRLIAAGEAPGIAVERNDNLVTISISAFETHNEEYVIDLAQGGNLVRSHAENGPISSTYAYRFKNVDDIWVPTSVTYEHIKEGRKSTRTLEWTKSILNSPIADD